MTNSKTTKHSLVSSAIAVFVCAAMLIGTTFAWFTDTASTAVNKIQSGTLDVALEMKDASGNWVNAEGEILTFKTADNRTADRILWEPGCTYELPELRVVNNGKLALKYEIMITGIIGDTGLNEVIDWTFGNLQLTNGVAVGNLDAGEKGSSIVIKGHMKDTAGNEYQNKSIDGIAVTVRAAQMAKEYDSSKNDYDANATFSDWPITVSQAVAKDENGNITDQILTKNMLNGNDIQAQAKVPAAAIKDSATGLLFSVRETAAPANFVISNDLSSETYEIKVTGLKDNNTVPIVTKLFVGKNLTGVGFIHNANDAFTAVNSEAEVDADKEYYYDSATGYITFSTVSFSPFTVTYKNAATIGKKSYVTLSDAIAAVKDGETLKLLSDYSGIVELNGKKNITFDFNGNTVNGTITIGCKYSKSWGFSNKADGSSVIFADSKKTGGVTTDYSSGALVVKNGSDVTINGGNFVQTYHNGSSGYSNAVTLGENSTLTVNGGYIRNNATVGNYNRVINVDNNGLGGKVTVNGGKLEGTKKCGTNGWYGSYSYLIASNSSDDKFNVEINAGEFVSHTSYSWLTQVYGDVVVNDCTFVSEGHTQVFDIKTDNYKAKLDGISVTVKGGTFTVADPTNKLSGFAYCNKSLANAYGYAKGSLVLDPTTGIKINTTTHQTTLGDCGVTQSAKDADGYYTITKK